MSYTKLFYNNVPPIFHKDAGRLLTGSNEKKMRIFDINSPDKGNKMITKELLLMIYNIFKYMTFYRMLC